MIHTFRLFRLSLFFVLTLSIKPACFPMHRGETSNTFGQLRDAGLWSAVNIEKKITQSFSINFSEEFRFNENCSELGTFFSDLGIHYTFYENIKVGAYYRFSKEKQVNNFYSSKNRYYMDASYKKKIERFSIQFRYRFQSQYSDFFSSETGKIPVYRNRYKFTFRYAPDKLIKPFFAVEAFEDVEEGMIDKMRYSGGFDYEFNKRNMINVFYLIQKEMNVNSPQTDFIIGTGYGFIF